MTPKGRVSRVNVQGLGGQPFTTKNVSQRGA
jgi:hypothetical protein